MNKLLDVYAHVQFRIKVIKTIVAAYDLIMIYIITAIMLNQEVVNWNSGDAVLIKVPRNGWNSVEVSITDSCVLH